MRSFSTFIFGPLLGWTFQCVCMYVYMYVCVFVCFPGSFGQLTSVDYYYIQYTTVYHGLNWMLYCCQLRLCEWNCAAIPPWGSNIAHYIHNPTRRHSIALTLFSSFPFSLSRTPIVHFDPRSSPFSLYLHFTSSNWYPNTARAVAKSKLSNTSTTLFSYKWPPSAIMIHHQCISPLFLPPPMPAAA